MSDKAALLNIELNPELIAKMHPNNRLINYCAFILLFACTTLVNGCIHFTPAQIAILQKPATVMISLTIASSEYYQCTGHWPKSLDDLRSQEYGRTDAEKQKAISDKLAEIGCSSQLDGKVVFKEKPDGTLEITIPPLKFSGDGVDIASGGTTATVSVPIVTKTASDGRNP